MSQRLRHAGIAVLLLVALLGQGTWVLAGTTGTLSGTVRDLDGNSTVANARVTVLSPSQTTSTLTDATGHFTFVSLAPDTYTVSVNKEGYENASEGGVTVLADQVQTLALSVHKTMRTIAQVTSRAAGSLVKPGTTSDVYSVNAKTQEAVSALGGGGGLNSAYSAVATVPGAYVPLNQAGYYQTVHIRGGNYDQVGYEVDGVPVNRSFDNYPSGAASSLGQQELQVYTGSSPANSEGQALAGYINQVIKTGTYPGFGKMDLGAGSPAFYHKFAAEAGGATPNRLFSYYVGLGGYNQDYRYVDQSQGVSLSLLAPALAPLPASSDPAACGLRTGFSACYNNDGGGNTGGVPVGPGGYLLAPYTYALPANVMDRDTVVNVHFGIPHKNDGGRDDVQLLYDNNAINTAFFSSTNDIGGSAAIAGSLGVPTYTDGYQYNGVDGVPLPANYQKMTSLYYFPNAPSHAWGSTIPANVRDTYWNDQNIFKAQYQRNMSSNAYLRLYGYTYYSDWTQYGPQAAYSNYASAATPDYELSSHTRGASATFADQINAQHLITAQASYTTASSVRDNNTQMYNTGGSRSRFAVLVDPNNPFSGICYTASGKATTCSVSPHPADFATLAQAYRGTITTPAATCGTGPCTFYVMESSQYATYNTVRPQFSSFSLTDQFRPSDKLLLNLGLRYDRFAFVGSNTARGAARAFWFNAWNQDNCIDANGVPHDKVNSLGIAVTAPCPAGYTAAALQNQSNWVTAHGALQPRLGGTYTMNPDTVLRFSAGLYVQPPNAAHTQYNTLQENLPAFLGARFYKYGFTTPGHDIRPQTSLNADFSYERHFKGTDMSLKITPFVRKTKDQVQEFYLDQATSFVSGLNVGRQTSEGVEFQMTKGDFSKNGLSGLLSFTYTHSEIKYGKLANGTTILDPINSDIRNYNAYTSYCAAHGTDARCGQTSSGTAAGPCYDSNGNPHGGPGQTACTASDIGNPYWNAPVQRLLDPNASYAPYSIFPAGIGSSADSFEVPYVATMVLNYRHDRFSITPSLQFQGGNRYGAPESQTGIDPAAGGCTTLASGTDERYPFGNPAPNTYDARNCNSVLAAIPNAYTGKFDTLGAFLQPSQIVGNLQISYEVSPKIRLRATAANLFSTCFGGSAQAWTMNSHKICGYGTLNNGGSFQPVGNVYNPGAPIQRLVQYPYAAYASPYNANSNSTVAPLNVYFDASIKF